MRNDRSKVGISSKEGQEETVVYNLKSPNRGHSWSQKDAHGGHRIGAQNIVGAEQKKCRKKLRALEHPR